MQDSEYFSEMLTYDFESNQKVLKTILSLLEEKITEKVQAIFSHLLAAQHVWHQRIIKKEYEFQVWEDIPSSNWENILGKNYQNWQKLIQDKSDLQETFQYQTTSGKKFQNTISEVLNHLLIHSSYHRGQVIVLLRPELEEVPLLDYIFHIRKEL